MKLSPQRAPFYAIVTILSVLTVVAHVRLLGFCADDAYIHLRMAQNLLSSGKPYFNPAEAVMATSSVVWTLSLSIILALSGSSLTAVAIFASLVTICAGLAWARLASFMLGRKSNTLESAVFVLSSSLLLTSSIQLMETPLALLLAALGGYFYFRGKRAGIALLVVACFTRLELSALLLVLLGENFLFRRISLREAALTIVLSALPFIAFELIFYGTLLPQTVRAKSQIYALTSSEVLTFAAAGMLGKFVFFQFPLLVLLFFTLLTIVAIYFCLFHLQAPEYAARDQRNLLYIAGGLFVFLGYLGKSVYIFPWYVPLYLLPIYFGLLFAAFTKNSWTVRIFVLILLLPQLFVFSRGLVGGLSSPVYFDEYEGGVRAQEYRKIGEELRSSCAECTVLAAEIGALGFGFQGKVVDAAGLASPEALQFHPKIRSARRNQLGGSIPTELVRLIRPDIIVGMESFLTEVSASDLITMYSKESKKLPFLNQSEAESKLVVLRKKSG